MGEGPKLPAPRAASRPSAVDHGPLAWPRGGTIEVAEVLTVGLAPEGPVPPPDGPLGPVEGGWLLSSAAAPPRGRLLGVAVMSAAMLASDLAEVFLDAPLWMRLGVFLVVGAMGTAALVGRRTLRHLLARRMARRLPMRTALALPEGSVCRLNGVVGAGKTFASPGSGAPAVLSLTLRWEAADLGVEVVRGHDFEVETAHGERVLVEVRGVQWLDRPRGPVAAKALHPARLGVEPTSDARHVEIVLGPGDRVEVVGQLRYEVDAAGQGDPGRGTPMRPVLFGTPGAPLLVGRR